MLAWVRKMFAKPAKRNRRAVTLRGARGPIQATYDAAARTDDNKNHWAHTDSLSAAAANDAATRKILRERARYEIANNSYAKGITLTLANHLVGDGPRLQVTTPDPAVNRAIEKSWAEWADAVRLPDQLRTMKQAKVTDGEAFVRLITNPTLPTPVYLDMRLIESDQVTDPWLVNFDRGYDGITFDDYENPVSYSVSRYHPGDTLRGFALEYDEVPARRMVHWFRCDRPGQIRGIPEITPGLPLFAQLRRFTLATLTAAETAAMFAAVLMTPANANTDDGELPEYWSQQEIVRGMMTALPDGFDMKQFSAEHPSTTYDSFIHVLLREISRCLNIPYHLAAGDYSSSNYSTARLGSQDFRLAMRVERQDCEREVLDPVFREWMDEAVMVPGVLPPGSGAYLSGVPHVWHWPAWEHIDPMTEAQADTERLTNKTTTMAEVCGARGTDWKETVRQQVIEEIYRAQVRKELGAKPEGGEEQSKPEAKPANAAITAGACQCGPDEICGCGGKGGKPGPCPTAGADAKKAGKVPASKASAPKAKRTAKPVNVKVKAATEKVAKINAKVEKAKTKLADAKAELKAAKADLALAKGTAAKKAAASLKETRPNVEKSFGEVSKLYGRAASESTTREQMVSALDAMEKNKPTVNELKRLAKRVGVPERQTRPKLLLDIREALLTRKGMAQRVKV